MEEIEAEYASLKANGVHPATKQMRALRAEKAALEAADDDEAAGKQTPKAEVTAEVGPGGICVSEPAPDDGIALSEGVSDVKWHVAAPSDGEWEFIQKCIAELPIPLGGLTSGMFKKMYDRVVLQTKLWRRMRTLHAEVGVGGDFPAFADFELSPNDGRPLPPKSENGVLEAPQGTVSVDLPAPNVTEGQMPVRPKTQREELLAQMGGRAKFDPRPVPAGAP